MTYRNFVRFSGPLLALGTAAALLAGCRHESAAAQQQPPAPSVTVAPVEQREIVEWDEFTGRTEPVESVEVRPRVSGYIQEVRFQSGQLVKKGDVLFVIDPRWHKAEFDRLPGARPRAPRCSSTTPNAKPTAPNSCSPPKPSPPRKAMRAFRDMTRSESRAARRRGRPRFCEARSRLHRSPRAD